MIDVAATIASKPKSRKWLIALAILGLLVLLFGAIGAWIAPSIAKTQIERRGSEALGRTIRVGAVAIHPYTLTVELTDVVIEGRTGERPLLAVKSLLVDAEWASIIQRGAVLAAVRLTNPQSYLEHRADGGWNFDDIVAKLAAQPKSEGPQARFSVANIELLDGRIELRDVAEDTTHQIAQLEIGIPFLSNLPYAVETTVEPRIKANINDDPLVLAAHSTPFKESLGTAMEINLDDFDLPHYARYVRRLLPIALTGGKLKTALKVNFERSRDTPALVSVTGTLGVRDLAMQDAAGKPLLAARALDVNIARFAYPTLATEIAELKLDGLGLDVVRDAKGGINVLRALPPGAKPSPAADTKPLPVVVKRFVLSDATVRWSDESLSRPFKATLAPLAIEITDLAPAGSEPANVKLTGTTGFGSTIAADAKLTVTPLSIDGDLKLTGVKPQDAAAYFERYFTVDLTAQSSDLGTHFTVRQRGQDLDWALADAKFNARDFRIRHRATKTDWAVIPELSGVASSVDGAKQIVVVESLGSRGGRVLVERDRDGKVNWAGFLADAGAMQPPPAAQSAATGPPWKWSVKTLRLTDHAVQYKDGTTTPPVELNVTRINLAVDGASDNLAAPQRIAIDSVVNRTGKLAVKGSLAPLPLAGKLEITASDLDIASVQPYFTDRVNVTVTSGAVGARGTVELATPAANAAQNSAPRVTYRGDLTANNVATVEKTTTNDLFKLRAMSLQGVEVVSTPFALAIADTTLTAPFARIAITPEGKLNLSALVAKTDEEAKLAPEKPATPAAPEIPATANTSIRLGKVQVTEGNVVFSDLSIKPNFITNLTELTGSVSELTASKPGDVDLKGRIDGAGTIDIAGQVNPLSPQLYLDLKVRARSIELPPTTPYSIKYAGYGIQRGKLSLTLAYKIDDRRLAAENNVHLDQFTFGEKVDSPTATKLPVTLAVALLKDRNGIIDINLPIGGSLDDPKFSIGGIVVQVILNVLGKAITAPFALLGSLFGGGGDELGYAEFEAGSSALTESSEKRVQSLARALNERPALNMDIGGRVDPETDRVGLAREQLQRRIKQPKFNELARTKTPAVSVDAVTLTEEESLRALDAAYLDAITKKTLKPAPAKPTRAEMESALVTTIDITTDDLRALADRRAQAARDQIAKEGIAVDRLFVVAPKIEPEESKDGGKASRVDFSLK